MAVPDLPTDVLSHVAALIPPPFFPGPNPLPTSSTSTARYKRSSSPRSPTSPQLPPPIDPLPPPARTPANELATLCRTSVKFLESARPWLWEDVDVRSGRGWLAIVDALTEEVVEETTSVRPILDGKFPGLDGPESPRSPGDERPPLSPDLPQAPDAHPQSVTVPGGYARYIGIPPSQTYPPAVTGAPSSSTPRFSYSPPQPSNVGMILTPPRSRDISPYPCAAGRLPSEVSTPSTSTPQPGTSPHPGPSGLPGPNSIPTIRAKIRGRSRSPRRGLSGTSPTIASVLEGERSKSLSGHRSRSRHASTRLHRTRTFDATDDEEEDEIMPLPSPPMSGKLGLKSSKSPRIEEMKPTSATSDLLPPPGPYIRHISFTNFRTIGSRRTQDEAVRGRYVTAGRLEGVIKNCPNLLSLCMTEYVDSSLTYPVVEELLFRGYRRPAKPRQSSVNRSLSLSRVRSQSVGPPPSTISNQLDPPRPAYVPYEEETEDEKWSRRGVFTPLQALDLTGCVSRAFTEAMADFYDIWLADLDDEGDRGRGRGRGRSRHRAGDYGGGTDTMTETETEDEAMSVVLSQRTTRSQRVPRFTALQRLSLRACTSLDPLMLHSFVLCFPNLTHLDLSGTRVPPTLLSHLTEGAPRGMRLVSLSLARCPRLDPYVVSQFLIHSPAAQDIVDLNLFVNPTQGNALRSDDLRELLSKAPCLKSGRLQYLDLSSAKFTPEHFSPDVFPPQPSLVSLGLSHLPILPLDAIANFLLNQAANVEILTLTRSADPNLRASAPPLHTTLELHAKLINPCTTLPFSLNSLRLSSGPDYSPGPTRLRVIELSSPIRRAIEEVGNAEWKVIRSKGGRGWYVDTSAGWVKPAQLATSNGAPPTPVSPSTSTPRLDEGRRFVRHLPSSDPWRRWLTSLSDANGRVSSGVGWHSRKMEVVKGWGMLGREEGMGGAGAFAFEE